MLWVMKHPAFRSCEDLTQETLLREHVIAFASVFGATSWSTLQPAHLDTYITILKITAAMYLLNEADYRGDLIIE
jgi:hypothetical protein